MKIRYYLKYMLGILSFLCLYACQQDMVYFEYEPVPTKGWSRQDTLQFYLPDTLSVGTYNLEIGVRHSGKYPYRDLWLELTQYVPDVRAAHEWIERKDTFHLFLANEQGYWIGTGTTGGHFQILAPAGQITFIEEGKTVTKTNKDTASEDSKETDMHTLPYTFEGKKHTLQRNEKFHLQVTQIMTDTLLLHVSDIGLRLSPL